MIKFNYLKYSYFQIQKYLSHSQYYLGLCWRVRTFFHEPLLTPSEWRQLWPMSQQTRLMLQKRQIWYQHFLLNFSKCFFRCLCSDGEKVFSQRDYKWNSYYSCSKGICSESSSRESSNPICMAIFPMSFCLWSNNSPASFFE